MPITPGVFYFAVAVSLSQIVMFAVVAEHGVPNLTDTQLFLKTLANLQAREIPLPKHQG